MAKVAFLSAFLATAAWAQPPAGMSDFLPLAVGNRWLYSYYHEAYAYTQFYSDRVDSGTVEITVTGVAAYPEYNLWHLQETANYRTRLWQHSGGDPDQDSIVHSQLLFDVQEVLTGQHWLTNFGGSWIFRFVFPYDTTVIYRYAIPSTLDLKRYSPPVAYNSGSAYQRSLVFRAAVGVDSMGYSIKYSSSSGNVGAARLVDHTLVTSAIAEDRSAPGDFSLEQNYPNPFNPVTIIHYTIAGTGGVRRGVQEAGTGGSQPASGLAGGLGARKIRLAVYDVLGREVAVLVDEKKSPGLYEVSFDGTGLASGVYLYRLIVGSFSQTRKMSLLR